MNLKKGKKNKRDRIVIETRYQTRQQPRKGRCSSFFLIYFIFFSPFGGKRGPWVLNFLFARLRVDEIGRQRSSSVPSLSLSLSLSFSEEIPRPVNCLRSLGNKETNKTATQDSENVLHYDRLPVYHEFTGITKSPSLNLFFFTCLAVSRFQQNKLHHQKGHEHWLKKSDSLFIS